MNFSIADARARADPHPGEAAGQLGHPAKANAIRAEFIRQADKLDGLADGVINNYMAARALFDVSQGDPERNPWAAMRARTAWTRTRRTHRDQARLTDGQIETLKLVY